MHPATTRTLALLLALVLGAMVPQAHSGAAHVRYLIMAMLFIVFLQTQLSIRSLQGSHLWLLAANIGVAFLGWGSGYCLGNETLALALFFTGIAPTATAAPVIVSFLRGRVDYVVTAFLLSNLGLAALMPLVLPLVLGRAAPDLFLRVAGSMALVVFAPMTAALLLRRVHPAAREWPSRLRNLSFGLWLSALFLITSNASHFLRTRQEANAGQLALIAGASAFVCAVNFALGRSLGGREFAREASQSLGQKNTTFTLYLALTYANPLVALGPTFYVLWHNLWNTWQLHRFGRVDVMRV